MTIKEIKDSDINNIFKGLSDPEVTKYYDVHYPTIESTMEQMEWYKSIEEKGTGKWWGIYNNSDEFCGTGGFYDLDKDHQKAEFGIWLLKEFWGKGIMKKVVPIFLEKGFTEFSLNRIEAYVYCSNEKCKNALSKTAFQYEGTMREYEMKNGVPIDMDIYAALKPKT